MKTSSLHEEAGHEPLRAFQGKSFLSTSSFRTEELSALLDLAILQKHGKTQTSKPLDGKSVALIFFNPSLRTRTSMCVAVQHLGGLAIVLDPKDTWPIEFEDGVLMNQASSEHIREAAPVLATYVDAIGVRCFPSLTNYQEDQKEKILNSFEKFATIPIINLESATEHPLQGLADMMTIKEEFKSLNQRDVVLAWANHPKALPMSVPNTFAIMAAQFGMNLTVACPSEYELSPEIIERIRAFADENGGSCRVVHSLDAAMTGAEVIYAKSWGSLGYYGKPDQEHSLRRNYRNWIITKQLMKRTQNARFMHCLPVRRNVVVRDEVLDSGGSVVIRQAANRLHVQKTLLSVML